MPEKQPVSIICLSLIFLIYNVACSCSATKDGVRDCICDTGYIGDGRFECRIPQRNCADLQTYFHISESGIPSVGIWGPLGERTVYCDMVTNGG